MTTPPPPRPPAAGRPGGPPQYVIPVVVPPGPDRSLMVSPVAPEIRALSESKLITPEQSRALTTATASLSQMTTVMKTTGGKAPGERHFNRIDTLREMRMPTPIGEARNVLHAMAASWGALSKDFHTYRQLFYEARLRRAKLNKKMHAAVDAAKDQDLDDLAIHEAEIQLEAAEIDALEARVAKGHSELTSAISVITAKGEQYALLVSANGGREFSESDFREEEITYHLSSAWWVAAEAFNMIELTGYRGVVLDVAVDVKRDILLYFKSLGISEKEVKDELRGLAGMRASYEMARSPQQMPDFSAHFESWITRTVAHFTERVKATVSAPGGFEKLTRITSIVDPPTDEGERGPDNGRKVGRKSITS